MDFSKKNRINKKIQASIFLPVLFCTLMASHSNAQFSQLSFWKKKSQTFTSSVSYTTPGTSTFTVPAGIKLIRVSVLGSGGGGSWGTNYCTGGGGSGGFTQGLLAVNPGDNFSVDVGPGGIGGSLGAGGAANIFGANLLIACGGGSAARAGGSAGNAGGGTCGGAGGTLAGSIGNGGRGGGFIGGNGLVGNNGGAGDNFAGCGGGAGAPGKSGIGTNGVDFSGDFGGAGGSSSAGLAGGAPGPIDSSNGSPGAVGTIPESGSGGGGTKRNAFGYRGGAGGAGAGGGGGYNGGGPGGTGWIYIEY